jgi:hypothetical protein
MDALTLDWIEARCEAGAAVGRADRREEPAMTRVPRNRAAAFASCLALGLLIPSAASADTFCVSDPGCIGMDEGSDLQAALTAAQNHAGPDRVQIGPGTFLAPAIGYFYSAGVAANTVDIVGAGNSTKLTAPTPPGDSGVATLSLNAPNTTSTISDLAVAYLPPPSGTFPTTTASSPRPRWGAWR